MITFVTCRPDGSLIGVYNTPTIDGMRANINVEAGEAAHIIPFEAAVILPINLDLVRAFYCAQIDREAGAVRSQFITDVPGQAQTYERKEAEARLWTAGDNVAQPDRYPFMIAEAQARDVPVADVQAEIMAQVNLLIPLAASVEAQRMCAKQAVSRAESIPEIAAAARVDWGSSHFNTEKEV